ncbi:MAG: flavin reductase family protein [Promethearchaeota archaeon]|nr:MAG: flavin reductase family protein [Candidatus Lokiarchaeota archaeon]
MNENRTQIKPYEYMEYFMLDTANLVSMGGDGQVNVMALLWKTIGQLWMIPTITVAVAPSRYTFELLTKGVPEFTVNIPSPETAGSINVTGALSGRNTNKVERAGLELIKGVKTEVPTIKGSLLSYECKIIHTCQSGKMASHHLFFGQILTAFASNDIVKK